MDINKRLIDVSKYSRPGSKLLSVSKLIVHYTSDPGATAKNIRRYFNDLKDQEPEKEDKIFASAHYVVDETEIIQMIPDDERAYHVGANEYTPYALTISSYPNARMLGFEVCHPTKSGEFFHSTYNRLINLLATKCKEYGLNPLTDINRHFDITEKICPKYYVDNTDQWEELLHDVKRSIG